MKEDVEEKKQTKIPDLSSLSLVDKHPFCGLQARKRLDWDVILPMIKKFVGAR